MAQKTRRFTVHKFDHQACAVREKGDFAVKDTAVYRCYVQYSSIRLVSFNIRLDVIGEEAEMIQATPTTQSALYDTGDRGIDG